MTEDSSNGTHEFISIPTVDIQTYSFSIYAKANTRTKIQLVLAGAPFFGGGGNGEASFDLSSATVISAINGATGTIQSVGNGWYRCTISKASTASGSGVLAVRLLDASANASYTGNGTSSAYYWGAQLNVGSTAKPYFPTTDRLNVPRLTYENGCPSLLLEKQSTNVNTWSEDLTNAAWNKYYASINSNAITSPDGTQNADKVVESPLPVTAFHYVESTNYISNGTTYTVSCFLKKAEREFAYIGVYTTQSSQIRVNLTTGAIVGTVGTWIDTKIQNFGNGWYRVIGTFTASSTTYFFSGPALDATTLTYIGDGTSGIHIWGAQIEQSSYATSYIPTTSTSVTRLADSCSKTSISSLIGQTEGTLFVDIYFNGSGYGTTNDFFLYVGDGANTDAIYIDYYNNLFRWVVFNGSTLAFYTDFATTNGRHKLALGYKAGQYVAYADGNLILEDTSATAPPTCAMLSLAQNVTGFSYINKKINSAMLWKTRLTNTELAQLTTI